MQPSKNQDRKYRQVLYLKWVYRDCLKAPCDLQDTGKVFHNLTVSGKYSTYVQKIITLRPYVSHRKFLKLNFLRKIRSYVAQYATMRRLVLQS